MEQINIAQLAESFALLKRAEGMRAVDEAIGQLIGQLRLDGYLEDMLEAMDASMEDGDIVSMSELLGVPELPELAGRMEVLHGVNVHIANRIKDIIGDIDDEQLLQLGPKGFVEVVTELVEGGERLHASEVDAVSDVPATRGELDNLFRVAVAPFVLKEFGSALDVVSAPVGDTLVSRYAVVLSGELQEEVVNDVCEVFAHVLGVTDLVLVGRPAVIRDGGCWKVVVYLPR